MLVASWADRPITTDLHVFTNTINPGIQKTAKRQAKKKNKKIHDYFHMSNIIPKHKIKYKQNPHHKNGRDNHKFATVCYYVLLAEIPDGVA